MIEFFGNCLLRQFPDWGKRLTWFAGIMGALLWLDATSCFVCRGRDLVSVVEWLYLETRWYIWPALISLISFFLLMESPDWREPPAIWRNPLSNFLEILPGIVEIFGAVLIWGLTCITVALAPDCTTRGTIPTWSLVERKENLSGKNNDRQRS